MDKHLSFSIYKVALSPILHIGEETEIVYRKHIYHHVEFPKPPLNLLKYEYTVIARSQCLLAAELKFKPRSHFK